MLGKFLASLSLFAVMLLPTAGYLVFMYLHSEPLPPWRMLLAGYLGVLLLGGALLALGTFHFLAHGKSAHRRRPHVRGFLVPLGLGFRLDASEAASVPFCNIFP